MNSDRIKKKDNFEGKEQRRFQRVYLDTNVLLRNLHYEHASNLQYYPADLKDLSITGMRFATSQEFVEQDELRIIVQMFEVLSADKDSDLDEISQEKEFISDLEVIGVKKLDDGTFEVRGIFFEIKQGNVKLLENFIAKFNS
jgi:hypothetical protein